jgi:hypothetical protein
MERTALETQRFQLRAPLETSAKLVLYSCVMPTQGARVSKVLMMLWAQCVHLGCIALVDLLSLNHALHLLADTALLDLPHLMEYFAQQAAHALEALLICRLVKHLLDCIVQRAL